MKKILTIAGYDPSSGAGITKDLEIFSSQGMHGISIPTCIVLQGPQGVRDVYPVPYPQFFEMIDMVKGQLPVDGIKIGALWNEAYVEKTALFLKDLKKNTPIVIDPVLAAKNRIQLLTDRGLRQMKKLLFPAASVVTPNTDEASLITGKKVNTLQGMKEAAEKIFHMGPKAVIVKGGHLKGQPVDLFYDGREFISFKKRRIDRSIHGTGCMFSSLFTSFLALGYEKKEAFLASAKDMGELLGDSYRIDADGYYYASPGILHSRHADRWMVLQTMRDAGEMLGRMNMVELIPAVQMNVGYAITNAKGVEDVAAFPGRIGQNQGRICMKGEPVFGASSHVARLILTYMKYYPHIRSCVDVKYDKAIIKKAQENGLYVLFFDRKTEPKRVKKTEGSSLDFLVDEVLKKVKSPPDIIYDLGDIGKEPIIRLFAEDPFELIKKMEMIRL